jgi:3-hydroxyacyl-[acyl-carrier-protein] dehydratase
MLKDHFYEVKSKENLENSTVQFTVQLNVLHPIFEGHFPGNPVTPGVVQLEMIKELLNAHLDQNLHLVDMPTCKFLAILNPNNTPVVSVDIQIGEEVDDKLRINASIKANEAILKMSGFYA